MNTLVLGLGNILVSDDQVVTPGDGVQKVHAGRTAVENFNRVRQIVSAFQGVNDMHPHTFVADAIRSDKPPASIVKLTGDEVHAFFQTKISPHQLGLCDLLASLALSDEAPERVTIVGIVPDDLELGTDLSPRVAEARDAAVEMIVEILSENGQVPEPRQLAAIGTA